MIPERSIAFLLFAIVAAVTPGPSNLILTATAARVGVVRGLPCLAGVAAGMGLMIALAAFGLGSLVFESPVVLSGIKWCGSLFLLWLSWEIATARPAVAKGERVFVGFWQAAAFQWVNPKAWLVSASAVGTFLPAGAGGALVQSLSLGGLFILAALPSCFVWMVFGAALQRILQTERAVRIFNVAMGGLLASSVLFVIR